MFLDYFALAVNNIRRRGIRSWLTMLGIFIGIAAVIALVSLGQGLQQAITGQFSSLSADRLIVSSIETGFGPPGSTAVNKLTEHDASLIESVPGVKIVIPRLIRTANVAFNDIALYKFTASIPEESDKVKAVYDTFNMEISKGRLLTSKDRGKVFLGDDFVKDNEYDKEIKLGSKIIIEGREFEVIGILKRASTFQLNSVVMMAESDMKDILEIGDEIDVIAVIVNDPKETESVALKIVDKMRKDRKQQEGEEDFSVQTPVEALSSINIILDIITIVVTGIAAISLLIGGVGISNTMFTSVLERTKEIGVMKAIGARNTDILTLFLLESGLLGIVGGFIGILIGLGLAFGFSALASIALGGAINLKVSISLPLVLGAFVFSLFIGIISGIVPALQAARLHPVEALRK